MIYADWSISFTSILAEYEWYETRKNSFYSFLSLFQSDQNLRFWQGDGRMGLKWGRVKTCEKI